MQVMQVDPDEFPQQNTFAIGLFDVGNANDCIFAFCCTQWAAANSRNFLDGSPCCFNYFCLPICAYRWMARSAYGIGNNADCGEDCLYSTFCSCCVANQLLQTSKVLRNPTTNGGVYYNTGNFNDSFTSGNGVLQRCLCSFFCTPCMMGKVMEESIGMPFWLGCFCMNPFAGRNVMRYHYRLRPYTQDDNTEELLVPVGALCLNNFIRGAFPCSDIILRGAIAAAVMQMAVEANLRGSGQNRRYLVGYTPVPVNAAGVVSIAPAMVVPGPAYPNQLTNSVPPSIYAPIHMNDMKDNNSL